MSDTTPPAVPEPTPPTSGYASQPAAGSPYSPAAGAAKTPILSILSLVAGIVGFLGSGLAFIPLVGFIAWFIPIGAVVLGFLGKKKEPQAAKGLWLTGIILGFVSLAICVIALLVWVLAFATAGSSGYFY